MFQLRRNVSVKIKSLNHFNKAQFQWRSEGGKGRGIMPPPPLDQECGAVVGVCVVGGGFGVLTCSSLICSSSCASEAAKGAAPSGPLTPSSRLRPASTPRVRICACSSSCASLSAATHRRRCGHSTCCLCLRHALARSPTRTYAHVTHTATPHTYDPYGKRLPWHMELRTPAILGRSHERYRPYFGLFPGVLVTLLLFSCDFQ